MEMKMNAVVRMKDLWGRVIHVLKCARVGYSEGIAISTVFCVIISVLLIPLLLPCVSFCLYGVVLESWQGLIILSSLMFGLFMMLIGHLSDRKAVRDYDSRPQPEISGLIFFLPEVLTFIVCLLGMVFFIFWGAIAVMAGWTTIIEIIIMKVIVLVVAGIVINCTWKYSL